MSKIAIMGGSCFASLKNLVITHSSAVKTPFGEPSAPLTYGMLEGCEVVYLLRREDVLPHRINYRADIWALRDAGVQTVIATTMVAGISEDFRAGEMLIPDQLIDYTYGRENTFLGEDARVKHISFLEPYSESLRKKILESARNLHFEIKSQGTYGITQGPRFETRAEINRLVKEGCHFVGMTGMPEAALARELELNYATIALVVRNVNQIIRPEDKIKVEVCKKRVERLVETTILSLEENASRVLNTA